MQRHILLLSLILIGAAGPTWAEPAPSVDEQWNNPDLWKEEKYLILFSSRDYKATKRFAEGAAKQLELPLNLRGLQPNAELGLTFSKQECEDSAFDHPCYIARSYEEDTLYLSIEYSSSYDFAPKYYIVIAAAGPTKSPFVRQALARIKPQIPDAYIKRSKVFLGCHH